MFPKSKHQHNVGCGSEGSDSDIRGYRKMSNKSEGPVVISEFLSDSSRVVTLQRTTVAAKELTLHPPVVITIVKPNKKERPVHYIIFVWPFYLGKKQEKEDARPTHPIWSPALMGLLEKKAILGKRRSWCMVNTLTAITLGSHRWLMKRPILPKSLASIQCTSPTCTKRWPKTTSEIKLRSH